MPDFLLKLIGMLADKIINLLSNINSKEDIKVTEHPFFTRMSLLINSINYKLEFEENTGREKIIEDILKAMFHFATSELYKFAEEIDEKKDSINVRNSFLNHLMAYTKKYKNIDSFKKIIPDITEKDKSLLTIVIKKFEKWHSEDRDNLREKAEDVKNAKYLDGNKVKACVLLDYCSAFFVNILKTAQITLKNLDGDISNNYYRGEKIKELDETDFKKRIESKGKPGLKVVLDDFDMYCQIKAKSLESLKGDLINKTMDLYECDLEKYTKAKIYDISKKGISIMIENPYIYNMFLLNRSKHQKIEIDFSKNNCDIDIVIDGEIATFTKQKNMLGVRFLHNKEEEESIADWIITLRLSKQEININNQEF